MFIPKISITVITKNKIHIFRSSISENRGAFSRSGHFHSEVESKKDIGSNDDVKVVKAFDFLSQIWYNTSGKSACRNKAVVVEAKLAFGL